MSLLDDDLYLENNRFRPIDLDDIDRVYDSWKETEDNSMRLRRRGEICNKVVNSIGQLNSDIKKVSECDKLLKLELNDNKNRDKCYFLGFKLILVFGGNLAAYYYFFC